MSAADILFRPRVSRTRERQSNLSSGAAAGSWKVVKTTKYLTTRISTNEFVLQVLAFEKNVDPVPGL